MMVPQQPKQARSEKAQIKNKPKSKRTNTMISNRDDSGHQPNKKRKCIPIPPSEPLEPLSSSAKKGSHLIKCSKCSKLGRKCKCSRQKKINAMWVFTLTNKVPQQMIIVIYNVSFHRHLFSLGLDTLIILSKF